MRRIPVLTIALLTPFLLGTGQCSSEGATATAPATASSGSSSSSTAAVPGTLVLAPGESARIEDRDVTVRFTSVLEDSRCPKEVTCVWAGRARVAIEVGRDGQEARTFELEIGAASATVEVEGLRLTAEALDPYPRDSQTTPTEAYRLRLRVEVAGG